MMASKLGITTNLFHSLLLTSLVFLLMVVLEYTCIDEVRKLIDRKGGQDLYRSAIQKNLVNIFVLGPITYCIIVMGLCNEEPLTLQQQSTSILGILFMEGFLYYIIHKSFHEIRGLWWMHSFHHKFNTIVLPSTANAVSIAEFSFAYMTPIAIGSYITSADRASAIIATTIIAITNLMIHVPWFEGFVLPWFLVSTGDHLSHHRNMNGHYSAPIFHFDRMLKNDEWPWAKTSKVE